MGHEAAGTIHSIGKSVKSVNVGDRVAIEPGVPCRYCSQCKAGFYNLCRDMKFAAAPPDCGGTLAKYFRIAEDFVYKVPAELSLEEAVLVEPLVVAVHSVRLMDVRPGETVVVMGSGTVGLLCAAVSKAFGAERVMLVDVLEKKLEFARGYLKCQTFLSSTTSSPEENAENILKTLGLDNGGGVDTVIEASGASPSTNAAIHVLRPGGKFVQTGLGRPKIDGFPIGPLSEKEIMVRGCFRYAEGDFELAVGMLRRGVVEVKSLISSVSDFSSATGAWDKTASGEGIKNLIRGVQD